MSFVCVVNKGTWTEKERQMLITQVKKSVSMTCHFLGDVASLRGASHPHACHRENPRSHHVGSLLQKFLLAAHSLLFACVFRLFPINNHLFLIQVKCQHIIGFRQTCSHDRTFILVLKYMTYFLLCVMINCCSNL